MGITNPLEIISGLEARGLTPEQAAGVAENMRAESGFDTGINEKAPVVPGSRGGYGLNQWTGPRRVAYEAFAKSKGVAPDDLNAQLDFTIWELHNTEQGAYDALMKAGTAEDAARVYEKLFLRPGVPHSRAGGGATAPSSPAPMGNPLETRQAAGALAMPSFQYNANLLNPADFMQPRRNSLA